MSVKVHGAEKMRAGAYSTDNGKSRAIEIVEMWDSSECYTSVITLLIDGPRALDKAQRIAAAINSIMSEADAAAADITLVSE